MSKLYRLLAVSLILLGLLTVFYAVRSAFNDMTHTYNPNPIRCDSRGCRSILADGSLADDRVARPEGSTR